MDSHILEEIIRFTDHAHGEQKRKYTDERYIVHPIRVMQTVQQYTNERSVLAAALLHDVLEDTPVTTDQIKNFLIKHISHADADRALILVIDLTDVYTKKAFPRLKRKHRKELEFRRLGKAHPDAQTIKYADIMDNSVNIVTHDPDFGRVYLEEAQLMLAEMTRGNPVLYERAKQTVRQCMEIQTVLRREQNKKACAVAGFSYSIFKG